jgi:hypothetical protein
MSLQVVGAGLPRTATSSLSQALEHLLGGRCYHMSAIPGHPFNLGDSWELALQGGTPEWEQVYEGFVAAVDWPTSAFWREVSEANPDALVLLSTRDSAETWWQSMDVTVLLVARMALAPNWNKGTHLVELLERFTGTKEWDDPATLMAAYERHNAEVRATIPSRRLLEWRAAQGWEPICRALDVPVPDFPFPWTNKRENWG